MSAWEAPGASDEWYTPPAVFAALRCTFDLDVAHPARGTTYVPAARVFSDRGLERDWSGFVWMNPPFGGRNALVPWLNKFFDHGDGIALTPDRTSAPWFQSAVKRADTLLFTRKLRFLRPDGTEGKSPSCGTTLWASGPRGVAALERAARGGFGFILQPMDTPTNAWPHSLRTGRAVSGCDPRPSRIQFVGQTRLPVEPVASSRA